MNLNTGFFPHRRKQQIDGYRVTLNNQQHHHTSLLQSAHSSSDGTNGSESFLPSVINIQSRNDGHRPYRRNDFANNHLFIAKQKLARLFFDQSAMNIQSTSELIHLFDQHQPKRRHRSMNKHKRQENNSDLKLTPTLDQDVHLSVVNLVLKPALPSLQQRDPLAAISHRRAHGINVQTKAPRPSMEWINPAVRQHIQSYHTSEDDIGPNTISDELKDNNTDAINNTINPFDSSLMYVKSIIPSHSSHH